MNILEKIYYTWLILAIPFSSFAWIVFDLEYENKHPIIWKAFLTFIWLPIVIGLVLILIWAIVQVWNL